MIVKELSIDSLAGQIEFLSYKGKTGNDAQQRAAIDGLRSLIESVPEKIVSMEEAVSLHALAIAIMKGVIVNKEDPGRVEGLAIYAITLIEKSGLALEYYSGFNLDNYRHFENMTPAAEH